MTKAEEIIQEMRTNPRVDHPKDQQMRAKRECVRIEVPGLVELQYFGHNGNMTFITVVSKDG
ncbi:hypothetical protein [Glycomyces sp. YM15]|uniref:hypothetical protein n=1 Tax=Glycomyces sp. YM15 TaxID=2800446 RepID=UPI001965A7F5|nr:hypothetical protein [Glycomyces sp. YM15]